LAHSAIVHLITYSMVFLALAIPFGIASGALPNVQNTMNQITGPWPTIANSNCSFSESGPSGNCSLIDWLSLGGLWVFASIGSFLFRLGAVLYLMVQIIGIFGPLANIPWIGPIFYAFIIMLALYAWSQARGSNHGLGN
jgi:hypothetical protein